MKGNDYRVRQPLGKGGMGAVYLAEQVIANKTRLVVIKEMLDYWEPNDPQGPAKAFQQFEAEAATLVTLNHAGIPHIFDYFTEGGRNYIVMQYIEGENLEKRLESTGPLPVDQVVGWGIYLCKVLTYLGNQQPPVIHHDIKPANLILDTDGEVRLVDFGTAKARLLAVPGGRVGVQKSSIYGTLGYAAPEMHNQFSEPRSDVYALGATLYHLMTGDDPGQHPFTFPQLGKLPPEVSRPLQGALEQKVERRITAAQLQAQLAAPTTPALFTFSQGDVARSDQELAQLCDSHWDEARDHLYNQSFEKRFNSLGRGDLLGKVTTAGQVSDRDQGLEQFIRSLDPHILMPAVQVRPVGLDFGGVSQNETKGEGLLLVNVTRGWLRAELSSTQPWLSITPHQVVLLSQQTKHVTVTLKGNRIPLRGRLAGQVAINTQTVTQANRVDVVSKEVVPVKAYTSVRRTLLIRYGPPLSQGLRSGMRWISSLLFAFGAALLALFLVRIFLWDVAGWGSEVRLWLVAIAGGIGAILGGMLGAWRRSNNLIALLLFVPASALLIPYTAFAFDWPFEEELSFFFGQQGLPSPVAQFVGPAILAALSATLIIHSGLRQATWLGLKVGWAYVWRLVLVVAAVSVFLWIAPLTDYDLLLAGIAAVLFSLFAAFLGRWDQRHDRAFFVMLALIICCALVIRLTSDQLPAQTLRWPRYFDPDYLLTRLRRVWPVILLLSAPAIMTALLVTRLPVTGRLQRLRGQWSRIDPYTGLASMLLLAGMAAALTAAAPFYVAEPLYQPLLTGSSKAVQVSVEPEIGIIILASAGLFFGLFGSTLSGRVNSPRRAILAALLSVAVGLGVGWLFVNLIVPI